MPNELTKFESKTLDRWMLLERREGVLRVLAILKAEAENFEHEDDAYRGGFDSAIKTIEQILTTFPKE